MLAAMSGSDPREQEVTLGGVPALAAVIGDPARAAAQGTVLLLHGFTAGKEAQRTEAHSLARRGYLAITLDAVAHGARRDPDFEARFTPARGERSFFELVQQGAAELPAVIAALTERGWCHPGRLGACGISMGGITLFGAITARCAIDAVVTIVATPRWRQIAPSPHEQLAQYFPTPLFMQTASNDVTVAPASARALYHELVPRYAAAPERLRYLEHAGEGHMFSAPAWQLAWDETLAWFATYLRDPA
jgi:dienelactone hydrolase